MESKLNKWLNHDQKRWLYSKDFFFISQREFLLRGAFSIGFILIWIDRVWVDTHSFLFLKPNIMLYFASINMRKCGADSPLMQKRVHILEEQNSAREKWFTVIQRSDSNDVTKCVFLVMLCVSFHQMSPTQILSQSGIAKSRWIIDSIHGSTERKHFLPQLSSVMINEQSEVEEERKKFNVG